MDDVDALMDSVIQLSDDLINREKLEMLRRKHLSEIMSDESSFSLHMDTSRPVPRPWTLNRKLNRSKSIVGILIGDDEENKLDPRCKNIKRTEQLVYLKEAILRIGTFFQGLDPLYQNIKLQPDYSFESHTRDIEVYMCTSVNKRKYDIINLVSTDDDHCWVGELNGLVGWFPAKFVELIDERSKEYSQAGDDKVTQAITDLVRGSLCSSLKHILENGLKPPSILTGPVHPWMFIQEAATEEVNKDKTSVFSRLNLCSTFRLDDDAKVLTPDELLYRCVQFINQTHDKVNAKMDVKLRSLICMGLNEQVLHLWLECLCAADKSLCKYYNNTAILASPGWVLVKCELRILAQFSFQLSPDWELKSRNEDKSSFTHGVKDMLVKHHLFSWDL